MKVNSIGTNYQVVQTFNNGQKNKTQRVLKNSKTSKGDTISFQGKHTCAKTLTILLGGVGTTVTYGLAAALSTCSPLQNIFITALTGLSCALYGYEKGHDLDEIINESEKEKDNNLQNKNYTKNIQDKK